MKEIYTQSGYPPLSEFYNILCNRLSTMTSVAVFYFNVVRVQAVNKGVQWHVTFNYFTLIFAFWAVRKWSQSKLKVFCTLCNLLHLKVISFFEHIHLNLFNSSTLTKLVHFSSSHCSFYFEPSWFPLSVSLPSTHTKNQQHACVCLTFWVLNPTMSLIKRQTGYDLMCEDPPNRQKKIEPRVQLLVFIE